MLRFQDQEFEKIYEQSRYKELIWQSRNLYYFRISYALFIVFDMCKNISALDQTDPIAYQNAR